MFHFLFQDLPLVSDLVQSFIRQNQLHRKSLPSYWFYRTKHGIHFKLRRYVWDSAVFMETWWLHIYQRYVKTLPKKPIVIDVGAHIGSFSLYMTSQYPQCTLYAFEPDPNNFDLLKENIALNHMEQRILPFQTALGSQAGKHNTLYKHPYNFGMHTLQKAKKEPGAPSLPVKTILLDDIFQKFRIEVCDLLKLDCEGGEYEIILTSSEKTLRRIKNIALEYHKGGNIQEVKKYLEKSGMQCVFGAAVQSAIGKKLINVPLLYAWRV